MRRTIVGLVLAGGSLLIGADHVGAEADQPANATGPCTASATILEGVDTDQITIDPYEFSGVYEIPLQGTATYRGSVGDGQERDERNYDGKVVIKTPPGIPDVELTDEWTWKGPGTGQSADGSVDWNLPSILPRGVTFRVEGFHQDDVVRCEGYVEVQVSGGLFDSPLAPAAFGGTALAGVGVGFAGLRKRGVA